MDEKIAKLMARVPEWDASYIPYLAMPSLFIIICIASAIDFVSGLSVGRYASVANVAFFLLMVLALLSFFSFGYAHDKAKRAKLRKMLAGKK